MTNMTKLTVALCALILTGCHVNYYEPAYQPAPPVTVSPAAASNSTVYYGTPSQPSPANRVYYGPAAPSSAYYGPPPVSVGPSGVSGSSVHYGTP